MATPVINEFVFNHSGTDFDEFVEIFGDPNSDYSDYWILQIEGDSGQTGIIDSAVRVGTTNKDGVWATGFSNNLYENGTVSLLLVEAFTGSVGDDVDINDDGTVDSGPWTSVVDSVAVTDGDAGDQTYSSTALAAGFDGIGFDVGGASRIPDGTDSDTADWVRNDFDRLGANRSGTPDDGEAVNTPGSSNAAVDNDPNGTGILSNLSIFQIQGAGHSSPFVGQRVATSGIVTALDSFGFYLQDQSGDGDIATSDGIFVSSPGAPTVSLGDIVDIEATVVEFTPGGVSNNLSITQLSGSPVNTVTSSGNPLPAAVVLGTGGRTPPTEVVEDDAFGAYEPITDGIDFYESLEGMLVEVPGATAVSASNRFGETWVIGDAGSDDLNDRGGITLGGDPINGQTDLNPERIQIQTDSGITPGISIDAKVGDGLGDVTGVVDYSFGNFEVKPNSLVTVTDGGLTPEISALTRGADRLTLASYNVLNLSADGSDDAQAALLGQQVVTALNSPDILALQEIQDNNGTIADGTLAADQTLQLLIDSIAAAGGPIYEAINIDPDFENQQGGAPGGNIRVAYLYNPDRVDLLPGSVQRLLDPAFTGNDGRIPLEATFLFAGNEITLINNHFSSKFGSTPVYGAVQPFIDAGSDARQAQAQAVNDRVDAIKAADPDAKVIVLGDLNDFQFSQPLQTLKGEGAEQVLFNQIEALEAAGSDVAQTFIFEGNSQVLDHLLTTENLKDSIELDIVHVNTEFDDAAGNSPTTASDHEPLLARIAVTPQIVAPEGSGEIELSVLGTYESGLFDQGAAEIVAHDPASQRLFVINADAASIDVLDISGPSAPTRVFSIDVSTKGSPNSVAVRDGTVAVAIEAPVSTDPGVVAFFDADGNPLGADVAVGALPDMLTFTPDGARILVANEGEPDGGIDPLGSISIINISGGVAAATVQTAGFGAFNGQEQNLRDQGVRIFAGKSVAEDVEPEYIAVSPDGTTAFVTLQEANAVAVVDIATAKVTEIQPLGLKDHSEDGNGLDPSDRDGGINIAKHPVFGMYMPDAIASYTVDGTTYYVTANEGDDRGEDERIKDLTLDPEDFPDAAFLQQDEILGRLGASSLDGDSDNDGLLDRIQIFGARSFAIWDENGNRVADTGDEFARIIASQSPDFFNSDNEENSFDNRSDNKGAEPEGVVLGEISGQTYAFVGLERVGGIMVYNISEPTSPTFVQYINNRDFSGDPALGTAGDLGPEGLAFIPAADSPNGKPLLAVGNEVSGTTTLYEINPEDQMADSFTLQILHASDLEGGVDAIDRAPNFAAIEAALEAEFTNSITLSAGDNYIPGPFFNAASDFSFNNLFDGLYNRFFDLVDEFGVPDTDLDGDGFVDFFDEIDNFSGRVDVTIMNLIGFDASAIGNHEFDLGPDTLENIIIYDRGNPAGTTNLTNLLQEVDWPGAQFPYLASNLDFSASGDLADLFTDQILPSSAFESDLLTARDGGPDQPKIAEATIIEEGGEKIGVIGATTPILGSISSPGDVDVEGPTSNDMAALAVLLQPIIDDVIAQGVNKVVLVTHLQQISLEKQLIQLLSGVDVIIAGGSDTLQADPEDVARGLNPGDTPDEGYPFVTTNADGDPAVIVSTDGEYSYVGRLVVEFDADGKVIVGSIDENVSGAFATSEEQVIALYNQGGALTDEEALATAFAEGTAAAEVKGLTEAVTDIVNTQDGNILGQTGVYLEGARDKVRTEETNLGNLTADANLAEAKAFDPAVVVSIKNGGGIRAPIGEVVNQGDTTLFLPPQENPEAGKEEGDISQLDVANSLRFNNNLTLLTLTATQLLQTIEHGVAASGDGETPGQFPQVGGLSFSFDDDLPVGDRVVSMALIDENGAPVMKLVEDGELAVDPDMPMRIVTLGFLADGGDKYPFEDFLAADPPFADRVDLDEVLTDTGAFDFVAPGTEQDALAEYLDDNFNTVTGGEAFDNAETPPEQDTRIQNLDARADAVFEGLDDRGERIEGDRGDSELDGTSGQDTIDGGRGDDTINGGAGADILIGDRGEDSILGGTGADSVDGGRGDDTIEAGGGNDTVIGDRGEDVILGEGGDDSIDAGRGDDTVEAGEGDDTVVGERGEDMILGGTGDDSIDAGRDDDTVEAGDGDDTVNGERGEDMILGGAGNDSIDAGRDDDTVEAGDGNDTVLGDRGEDEIDGGLGDDSIDGGRDDDLLLGGEGSDTLRGDGGDDTLEGGNGDDLLEGGFDDDLFVIGSASGNDSILDFEPGDDKIELNGLALTSFTAVIAAAAADGDDLFIELSASDSLRLVGIQQSDLSEGDFLFT